MNYDDKTIKRHLRNIAIVVTLAFASVMAFVYIVDPYQQYRASDRYIDNSRSEIPGIARHGHYNSIIIGSSVANNHSPAQIDSLMSTPGNRWRTVNMSIGGINCMDYRTIIRYIFDQGKTKNVISALDFFSFYLPDGASTPYLLTEEIVDDYPYLLSYKGLEGAFKKIFAPETRETNYHFDERCGDDYVKRAFNVSSLEITNNPTTTPEFLEQRMAHVIENFDDVYLSLVKAHPETNWYIYFPPYPAPWYSLEKQKGDLDRVFKIKQHMIEQLLALPNVRLYDFQTEEDIIHDLSRYSDWIHTDVDVNRQIISDIASGKNRLTADNYLSRLDTLRRIAADIPLNPFE